VDLAAGLIVARTAVRIVAVAQVVVVGVTRQPIDMSQ